MKNKNFKILIVILLFVISITGCAFAFSFRNMTLDFIQLSDTHITSRQDTSYKALGSSKALLKDAIEQINAIKGLDFVLFTGDMVDSATDENFYDYYSLLSKLQYPSLNAFGNHDIQYNGKSREEVLEIVRKYNPNYTFSDTYYAFSPKTDYRIIILDGIINSQNSANGEISQEQLRFLDNELSQNQDKVVVIAMHIPSVEPFKSAEHSLLNANDFNNILLKYKNPIIVLTGHYHATKIRHYGNLVFVSTPSLVTYPMAFRHIKIVNFKDRVNFKFEFISTRLEDVKEQNRQTVISYLTLAGNPDDRDLEFTFYKKHPKSLRYKKNKIKNAAKEAVTSEKEIKKLSNENYVKKQEKQFKKDLKQTKEKTIKKQEKQVKLSKIKEQKVQKTKNQRKFKISNPFKKQKK